MKLRPEPHGNTEGMEWLGSWGGQGRGELCGHKPGKDQGKGFWQLD